MIAGKKFDKAKDVILKKSDSLKGAVEIKGYNFSKGLDFRGFIDSYYTTGFQATNLRKAIDIIKEMRKNKAKIFLAYTSNIVSSGLRETIAYLVKNNYVDVLVTTAGGVEEDIIKCLKPFVLGTFNADGRKLREKGINRIGNIFVPNDRYIEFEKLMNVFLKKMHERQKKENRILSCSEFIHELGKEVDSDDSILYWATKNNIAVFCPALTDGSIGDMIYFYKNNNHDFKIDITDDNTRIINMALNSEKTGIIALGGGLPKHHICNANLFREGADYAVYISTGTEGDGSNAGAKPEEAVSWGKIGTKANYVMVEGDATIIFPLVVAGAFFDV